MSGTTTKERLMKIETDISHMRTQSDKFYEAFQNHIEWTQKQTEYYDKRYASKLVQVIVYGGISLLATGIVAALFT